MTTKRRRRTYVSKRLRRRRALYPSETLGRLRAVIAEARAALALEIATERVAHLEAVRLAAYVRRVQGVLRRRVRWDKRKRKASARRLVRKFMGGTD